MMSKQVVPLNLFRLTKLTETENETINFCRSFGLFPSEIRCPNCNILLETLYHFKNRNATTFRYQCNRRLCHRKGIKNSVTLRANTWFNEARISIRKSLFMTYCFVYQMSYSDTIRETTINSDEDGKLIQTSRAFINTHLLIHKHVKISVDEWILETTHPQKHVKFLVQYIP